VRAKHLLEDAASMQRSDRSMLSPLDGEGLPIPSTHWPTAGRRHRWLSCGASSEILSEVFEKIGHKRPFLGRRLGYLPTPCPTTKVLENLYYPSAQSIAAAAYRLVSRRGRSGVAAWRRRQPRSRRIPRPVLK